MKKRASTRASSQRFVIPVVIVLVGGVIAVIIIGTVVTGFFTRPEVVTANSLPGHQVRFNTLTSGTTPMTEIPSLLPKGGVTINNQFVLQPLSPAQMTEVKITSDQAIKIGREYANAHPFMVVPKVKTVFGQK